MLFKDRYKLKTKSANLIFARRVVAISKTDPSIDQHDWIDEDRTHAFIGLRPNQTPPTNYKRVYFNGVNEKFHSFNNRFVIRVSSSFNNQTIDPSFNIVKEKTPKNL